MEWTPPLYPWISICWSLKKFPQDPLFQNIVLVDISALLCNTEQYVHTRYAVTTLIWIPQWTSLYFCWTFLSITFRLCMHVFFFPSHFHVCVFSHFILLWCVIEHFYGIGTLNKTYYYYYYCYYYYYYYYYVALKFFTMNKTAAIFAWRAGCSGKTTFRDINTYSCSQSRFCPTNFVQKRWVQVLYVSCM